MKENKSDIVRIHDDAPIGLAAARDASGGIPQDVGTSQAESPGKENVKDIQSGLECGVGIDNIDDVKVGDILEFYTIKEEKKFI